MLYFDLLLTKYQPWVWHPQVIDKDKMCRFAHQNLIQESVKEDIEDLVWYGKRRALSKISVQYHDINIKNAHTKTLLVQKHLENN